MGLSRCAALNRRGPWGESSQRRGPGFCAVEEPQDIRLTTATPAGVPATRGQTPESLRDVNHLLELPRSKSRATEQSPKLICG
jgi:hypothetical protein